MPALEGKSKAHPTIFIIGGVVSLRDKLNGMMLPLGQKLIGTVNLCFFFSRLSGIDGKGADFKTIFFASLSGNL